VQNTLANRIKKIITQQKIKQTELAKALGISTNYVTLLVTGRKTNISLTLAKLIESTYGYSADWILKGEMPPKAQTDIEIRQKTINRIMQLDDNEIEVVFSFVKSLDKSLH